jgi:hypothetical protein
MRSFKDRRYSYSYMVLSRYRYRVTVTHRYRLLRTVTDRYRILPLLALQALLALH